MFPFKPKYGVGDDAWVVGWFRDIACNDKSAQWMKHFSPLLRRIPAKRRGHISGRVLDDRSVLSQDAQITHVLLQHAPDLGTFVIAEVGCRLDRE